MPFQPPGAELPTGLPKIIFLSILYHIENQHFGNQRYSWKTNRVKDLNFNMNICIIHRRKLKCYKKIKMLNPEENLIKI